MRTPKRSRMSDARPLPVTQPQRAAVSCVTMSSTLQAFLDYLRRPKTVFDLKDRTKALLLLVAIIIGVQYLLKVFFLNF